jgi:hypothetical protein
MAVQYSPLPEFQMPNVNLLGAYAQGQALQQNALQQQRLQQQMELANLSAGYTANKDLREAEKLQSEQRVKDFELASKKYDYLVGMAPRLNAQNYGAWYKQVTETFPLAAATLPPEFDPEVPKLLSMQGADLKPQILQQQFGDTSRIMRVSPYGGPAEEVAGSRATAEQYEPIKGAGDAIVGYKSKYGRQVLSPEEFESGGTLGYIQQREGTGKNPRSSAQGMGQFIDSTFVDTYRKTFPDRARNMSPQQILAQRGTMVDGVPVEAPMLEAFTAGNQQRLKDAGFAPTKGNTYLAHFLGADGALDVLGASPDTPVSELLSPKAIKANPEVFAKAKTAGDLIKWAGGGAPTKMEPVGTTRRAAQDAALNIIADLDIGPDGEDRVSKLISGSTGGAIPTALSEVPRAFGATTSGRKAISELEAIASEYSLEKLGGKLGGQISDKDVQFISKSMGDIANPMIPAEERLAAWNQVKRRLAGYANLQTPKLSAAPRGQAGETEKPAERKRIKFMELGD